MRGQQQVVICQKERRIVMPFLFTGNMPAIIFACDVLVDLLGLNFPIYFLLIHKIFFLKMGFLRWDQMVLFLDRCTRRFLGTSARKLF